MGESDAQTKIIKANKIELIKIPCLEDLWVGNILELDIGTPEYIQKVDRQKGDFDYKKWPDGIWTASRGISKTGEPTIISKLYNRLSSSENIKELGIGLFIPDGIYLRYRFNDTDAYGWLISQSEGAECLDKKLREVGL
ncbi:MAG: hypothetical protein WC438_05200 [Candidatus Pacearchaeota archaeon]